MIDLRCTECRKLSYTPTKGNNIDESIICSHTIKEFNKVIQEMQEK